ncbi:MAG: cytochrome b [Bacteriovoracaceae bacterium]|nr:cytochrome b [Bacteriovoracaceae bacterium]
MNKTLIYDWPTRIFHWLFAGMFIAAFFIAKTFDDDSAVYPYHMLLGLSMAYIVILRIMWGLIGSRNAKFSSLTLKPKDLVNYLKGVLYSKNQINGAHNPASSWIALIMMFLTLGLAVTGYLMTMSLYKELVEEIHELLANAFIVAAVMHVSGIILHTYRFRDGISLSMINGKKNIDLPNEAEINHTYRFAGAIFFVMFLGFILFLNNNYDRQKQNLTVLNKSFQLGELENNEKGENEAEDD